MATATAEPPWRLAENALINLIEKSSPQQQPPQAAGSNADAPSPMAAAAAAWGLGSSAAGAAAGAAGGAAGGAAAGAAGAALVPPGAAPVPSLVLPSLARSPHRAVTFGMSGARRATAEIINAAQSMGLVPDERGKSAEGAAGGGQAPRLPPKLLASLQRQIEPRLEFAQEGTDERALHRAIEDASSLGLPSERLEEARTRFREVAFAAERRARRESFGLSNVHPPDEFRCPLTLTAMRDPVVASDGHSYERKAIEEVLRGHHPRSPLTREALRAELVPNHALRRRIEEHDTELDQTLEEVAAAVRAQQARQLEAYADELAALRAAVARSGGVSTRLSTPGGSSSADTLAAPPPPPPSSLPSPLGGVVATAVAGSSTSADNSATTDPSTVAGATRRSSKRGVPPPSFDDLATSQQPASRKRRQ